MSVDTARQHAGLFYIQWALNALLDLVYPPCCEHCGRVDTRWCSTCEQLLQALPVTTIPRSLHPFDEVIATGVHNGILRDAIHSLKYSGNPGIAGPLAERIARTIQLQHWHINFVIPVPIHHNRRQKRRYNQSELLAQELSQYTRIPVLADALHRERDTAAQVGLTRTERIVNVADAFRCTPRLNGETLLLVDDVCTTGATLSACAQALREAGAGTLYAITIAAADF